MVDLGLLRMSKVDTWSPLPPYVRRKHGAYYFVRSQKWTHLGRSAKDARAKLKEFILAKGLTHVDSDFLAKLFVYTKRRALRRTTEFTITLDDVGEMWRATKGRCALTGILFDESNVKSFSRRPWVPSLDRIDHSKGYTRENTRLICVAMNFALNQWGEEAFVQVATGFLEMRQRGKHRAKLPDYPLATDGTLTARSARQPFVGGKDAAEGVSP